MHPFATSASKAEYSGLTGAQVLQKPTAFEAIEQAANEASHIEARLRELTDRLIGERQGENSAGPVPVRSGLFGKLEDAGDGIKSSLARMDVLIVAIERALPSTLIGR